MARKTGQIIRRGPVLGLLLIFGPEVCPISSVAWIALSILVSVQGAAHLLFVKSLSACCAAVDIRWSLRSAASGPPNPRHARHRH
jgi:hypothetical protein